MQACDVIRLQSQYCAARKGGQHILRLFFMMLFAIQIGCRSVAYQEIRKGGPLPDKITSNHIHLALQEREGVLLKNATRKLYTKIPTIDAFDIPYQTSDLSLNVVIREKLHTAIIVQQSENILESMDGTRFLLPAAASAEELTDQVVSLIGGMFYGKSEVEKLRAEIQ